MPTMTTRLKHAWNAFKSREKPEPYVYSPPRDYGTGYTYKPDRIHIRYSNERSIISSIETRISIDVSASDIRHIRLDENDRYLENINSGLNNCLTLEANLDQAARAFKQDIAMTVIDKGVAAVVPVDTTIDPENFGSFDILTMRVGEILEWYPRHVKVNVYNEAKGRREEIILEKKFVAIIENPLYSIMNEPNSTLQRLIRKLNLLDVVDEQSSSGKLDLIIQLPYVIKSEARRQQAEQRRKDIEFQLKDSQYGIAYTDGTERITQLNRPAENNLLHQVEYLTGLLYSQLGLTEEILNGTADERAMLSYRNKVVEPILDAIVEAMRRTFLTKTARTQKQTIMYFTDPFKTVTLDAIAQIADKFTRNEIASSNEIRGFIGMKPFPDKKADVLRNPNMPTEDDGGDDSEEDDKSNEDDGKSGR